MMVSEETTVSKHRHISFSSCSHGAWLARGRKGIILQGRKPLRNSLCSLPQPVGERQERINRGPNSKAGKRKRVWLMP